MTRGFPVSSSARRGRAALFASATAAIAGLWAGAPARAANYFWDPGQSNADPGSGGTGSWDTTNTFWKLAGTSGDVVWPNTLTNTATFAGTAGTVTVNANLNALGMIFNTSGYTIAGGTSNTFNLAGGGINTTALTGGTTTINQGLNLTAAQTWFLGASNVLNLGATVSTVAGATTDNLTFNGGSGSGAGGTVSYSGTAFTVNKLALTFGATFNSSGTANVGFNGLAGIATQTAIGDGSNGTLNVTAGTFTSGATSALFLGNAGNTANNSAIGTINVTGGTLIAVPQVLIGDGYKDTTNGTGFLNISGGVFSTGTGTGNIRVGNNGTGSGTINLTAGTLATNTLIAPGNGTGGTGTKANIFNFNGGTLQATGTALNVSAGITANVGNGGVTVDTNGGAALIAASLTPTGGSTGGLNKIGVGTLTLTGSNTYTGNTNVSGGTLAFSVPQSLPTLSNITVANGALISFSYDGSGAAQTEVQTAAANTTFNTGSGIALDVANGVTATYSGTLGGSGNLVKTSAGTLILGGSLSYSGSTILSGGLLAVGATPTSGGLPTGSPIVFNNGGIASSDTTVRAFSGRVTLTGTGATTLTFGSPTTYTGSLAFTDTNAINLGTTTPTFAVNVPTTFTQGFAGTNTALTETGTGTLTLNGASTLSGGTFTIASGAGTVVLNNSTALGTDVIALNAAANATGTLGLTGGITVANTINLAFSRYDPTATTTPGVAQIDNISGNNTITSSGFAITAGGLGNIFQSDAGTLTISGNLSGTNNVTSSTRAYVLTGAGNGVISGNIAQGTGTAPVTQLLIKYGTGTWTLSGSNTYTGGTNVSGGTLRVANTTGSGTGTGAVNVGANTNAGVLAGTGTIGNGAVNNTTTPVTILQGGTITAGSGTGTTDTAGTLTSTGPQLWNASGTYVAKYDGTTNDQLVMGGLTASNGFIVNFQEKVPGATPANTYVLAVNQGATSAGSFNLNNLMLEVNGSTTLPSGYAFSDVVAGGFDDLDLTITAAAPEPTSLLLAGLAAAPLALGRRRRRGGHKCAE